MSFLRRFTAFASGFVLLHAISGPVSAAEIDLTSFKPEDIISKDVAIIGGGSSGCYPAIRLKDKGKSVIVVEKKDRVGGNTETYIDPVTGTPIDIGVLVFHNISVVTNYFERFDIPLTLYEADTVDESAYYDFRSGTELNITFPSLNETAAAFTNYAQFPEEYPKLNDGLFLPNPVPEDLLLPFGEFAEKYDIGASLNTMYELDPAQTATGFLTTGHHNNSEIYSKIQAELLSASSLSLDSEVFLTHRQNGSEGIQLVVSTPEGRKLILAKKLLITIPPKPKLLASFDLSTEEEEAIFSRFSDVGYYTSIVNNTGLPDNIGLFNYNADTPYSFPDLPAVYNVQTTPVQGLHLAIYGT